MPKRSILFICNFNSARSQIAEAFLKRYAGHLFHVESAGMKPGTLNPDVVKVMLESSINLNGSATLSVFDLRYAGHQYDAIIELCAERDLAGRPSFPGVVKTLQWRLSDPATFQGTDAERLQQVRELREQIRQKVVAFVHQAQEESFWIG